MIIKFFDIEVLDDLLTFQFCTEKQALNNQADVIAFKTGDKVKPLKQMMGGDGALAFNRSYECTILDYLYNDLNGVVDTQKLKILSDNIIMNKDFDNLKYFVNNQNYIIGEFDHFRPIEVKKMGLKKLQLFFKKEGVDFINFDFDKYTSIKQIKDDNLESKFLNYMKNDVISLGKIWNILFKDTYELVELLYNTYYDGDINASKLIGYSLTKISKDVYGIKGSKKHIVPIDTKKTGIKILDTHFQDLVKENEFKLDYWGGVADYKKSGGLHFVNHKRIWESTDTHTIIDMDIASMYPNIILNNKESFSFLNLDNYLKTVSDRLKAKKNGDKKLSNALKLLLNALFGQTGNEWNFEIGSYDHNVFICRYGQYVLTHFILQLSNGLELIQANTDGVTFLVPNSEKENIQKLIRIWEDEFNFTMESQEFQKLEFRDVNNYFGWDIDGNFKSKGVFADSKPFGYLSHYPKYVIDKYIGLNYKCEPYYLHFTKTVKYDNIEEYSEIYLTTPEKGVLLTYNGGTPKEINGDLIYYSFNADDFDVRNYEYSYKTKIKLTKLEDVELINHKLQVYEKLTNIFNEKNLIVGRKGKLNLDRNLTNDYSNIELLEYEEVNVIKLVPKSDYVIVDVDTNKLSDYTPFIDRLSDFKKKDKFWVEGIKTAKKGRFKLITENVDELPFKCVLENVEFLTGLSRGAIYEFDGLDSPKVNYFDGELLSLSSLINVLDEFSVDYIINEIEVENKVEYENTLPIIPDYNFVNIHKKSPLYLGDCVDCKKKGKDFKQKKQLFLDFDNAVTGLYCLNSNHENKDLLDERQEIQDMLAQSQNPLYFVPKQIIRPNLQAEPKTLIYAPTGAGKTYAIAQQIINHLKDEVNEQLIIFTDTLTNIDNLINQVRLILKVGEVYDLKHLSIGVYSKDIADKNAILDRKVIISLQAYLGNRGHIKEAYNLRRYIENNPNTKIIIDEIHNIGQFTNGEILINGVWSENIANERNTIETIFNRKSRYTKDCFQADYLTFRVDEETDGDVLIAPSILNLSDVDKLNKLALLFKKSLKIIEKIGEEKRQVNKHLTREINIIENVYSVDVDLNGEYDKKLYQVLDYLKNKELMIYSKFVEIDGIIYKNIDDLLSNNLLDCIKNIKNMFEVSLQFKDDGFINDNIDKITGYTATPSNNLKFENIIKIDETFNDIKHIMINKSNYDYNTPSNFNKLIKEEINHCYASLVILKTKKHAIETIFKKSQKLPLEIRKKLIFIESDGYAKTLLDSNNFGDEIKEGFVYVTYIQNPYLTGSNMPKFDRVFIDCASITPAHTRLFGDELLTKKSQVTSRILQTAGRILRGKQLHKSIILFNTKDKENVELVNVDYIIEELSPISKDIRYIENLKQIDYNTWRLINNDLIHNDYLQIKGLSNSPKFKKFKKDYEEKENV